ncbi:MAG: LEA type 2 family protein [candidate division WOR-3 bacterium]|nr:LEA type 2 family protein [candidate division WOR-3 bacterium]
MDKSKKIWLFLTLIVIACAAIKQRLIVKECKFTFISANAYDFTFSDMKVDFELKVHNPNNVDAILDKLDYTFFVNQTDVFSGTTGKGIKVPAGKSKSFTTTISLEYTKIGQAIVEAIRFKTASYSIRAKAYIKTIIGEITYPVEISLK